MGTRPTGPNSSQHHARRDRPYCSESKIRRQNAPVNICGYSSAGTLDMWVALDNAADHSAFPPCGKDYRSRRHYTAVDPIWYEFCLCRNLTHGLMRVLGLPLHPPNLTHLAGFASTGNIAPDGLSQSEFGNVGFGQLLES